MNIMTVFRRFPHCLATPGLKIGLLCFVLLSGTLTTTSAAVTPAATLALVALRTEYKENPLGIDIRKPRLSWQIQSDRRGIFQAAYQLQFARQERELRAGRTQRWDSGQVNSEEC